MLLAKLGKATSHFTLWVIIPMQSQPPSGSVFCLEAHIENSLSSPVIEGYSRKVVLFIYLFIKRLLLQLVFFMERNKIGVWQSIIAVQQHAKHFTTNQDSCS